ncbi:MAG: precorrin-2 C(20)-methyltransferase [Fervidobacterium sp.]|nr:precorrin-2 C(20)-methyltransferase [Fervidobacterium sp.]
MKGKLYAIGVGPGDKELITLKAYKILKQADIVFLPSGRKDFSWALNVIKDYIQCPYVLLPFQMEKDKNETIKENALKIYNHIKDNKQCVFATAGDVSMYSTFWYLYGELKKIDQDLDVEIIPGINSFSAASARLKIPVAQGQENFCVLSFGQKQVIKSQIFENIIVLKPIKEVDDLINEFIENGYREIKIAEKVGTLDEKLGNPEDFDLSKKEYFRLIIAKKQR